MVRPAIVASFFLALVTPPVLHAATVEQTCHKAVNKGAMKLYKQTLAGAQSCLKTRIQTSGATTNCLGDPLQLDPNGKLPLKEFLQTVQNGSADGQMQAWDKLLDDKQITQLYNYVRARADKGLPPGRPDEVGPNGGPWIAPKGWPRQP